MLFSIFKNKKNNAEIELHEEEIKSIKAVYEIAIQTRNFEIQQLINRNNFFMIFQGVLLAAVVGNQLNLL